MSDEYEWKEPLPSRAQKEIPRSAHGHFVVQMVIHDSDVDPGRMSCCGSLGEYHTRMIALAQPDTVDVVEQVGPLYWTDNKNKRHDHYLDHVVHKADKRKLGLTDKPYRKVHKEFGDEIAQVCRDGQKRGVIDNLFLVTEYGRDPVKLFNADLMRGCRDADTAADMEALTVASEMQEPSTIQSLVDLIGMGPRGFRAIIRLIRCEVLTMLADEKISHESRVTLSEVQHE
jgi:hypothetical protein